MIGKFQGKLFMVSLGAALLANVAAWAQDGAERNACLQYDQVDAIHTLSSTQIILEVDGGTTLYLLRVVDRCLGTNDRQNISIEQSGRDGCLRTTDTVNYGRHQCQIEDFTLIETQEQLDTVLANSEN